MSDVFHVENGGPANFATGNIKLSVNGSLVASRYAVGGNTIGSLVNQIAKERGIRTFSVYADGRKLLVGDSAKLASSFTEVDIVAKDARG